MIESELIEVEIDMSDDVLLSLSKMAHKQDITLNRLCVQIIEERISKEMKHNEDN